MNPAIKLILSVATSLEYDVNLDRPFNDVLSNYLSYSYTVDTSPNTIRTEHNVRQGYQYSLGALTSPNVTPSR